MKKYIGTKIIKAEAMSRGEYNRYRGWKIPKNEDPNDEGYLIKHSDNYESWSPKEDFEINYNESESMTFGLAIEALKKGEYVARKGWNGKNMYLFLAHGEDIQKCIGLPDKCVDTICVKTAQNTVVFGWLASQTDILSKDWEIIK